MKWRTEPLSEPLRVGLDLEAVPRISWDKPPWWKFILCAGWGTGPEDTHYVEVYDRRPGRFIKRDLFELGAALSEKDIVIVGHNAYRYDVPAVNGLLIEHRLPMLPKLRVQDTLNDLKSGRTYRNSLRAQCKLYGVNLKTGSPDWDLILQGDKASWEEMREYNLNDVVSTLALERGLAAAGLPCPIRTWKPRGR